MITRYTRPEMAEIWNDRTRYQIWLEIELAVTDELAEAGVIPLKEAQDLRKKGNVLLKAGGVDPVRVEEIEKTTQHDVIAFTTAVAEKVGSLSRYIHFGLTSSDVVDTGLSLLIQKAGDQLLKDIDQLLSTLKKRAREFQKLPTIGRSHGIFAEPTSFGLKFLGWYAEFERNRKRLEQSLHECRFGKLSGAVGVSPHWSPNFEAKVLKRLGLRREPVSTQVIPRDRHADFLNVIALCGASLERISIELRHLQRSEVGEVLEGFQKGQKGSSAMPHKRNPISSENLTGVARLLRGYAMAALENIALWHERDISHSSVERVALPDATTLLNYALNRMNRVLGDLVVREDRVQENLNKAGETVFSGHVLLALVKSGVKREEAYAAIQKAALASLDGRQSFLELLAQDSLVTRYLSKGDIQRIGGMEHQLRHVKDIYKEVLK